MLVEGISMEQISEKEIKSMAQKLNGQMVKVKIIGTIEMELIIPDVHCRYRGRSGILSLYNKDILLSMELFTAYMLKSNENRQIIEIKMDNEEVVTLHII